MPMRKDHRWIIFDADNTLWNLEALYDRARSKFCSYLLDEITKDTQNRGDIDQSIIDRVQRHRDLQLEKTHGYQSSRFARSFEDTVSFFIPFASPHVFKEARSIALEVFDTLAEPYPDLESAIAKLHDSYSFAIVTAGERWVQERRLNDFHLRASFQKTLIVERKTAETFSTFCDDNKIDRSISWIVGDSIRSDILPARNAGLNAVHLNNKNWTIELGALPDGVVSLATLSEVADYILRVTST
jgi:putative hydrolase of the HAD superfamily